MSWAQYKHEAGFALGSHSAAPSTCATQKIHIPMIGSGKLKIATSACEQFEDDGFVVPSCGLSVPMDNCNHEEADTRIMDIHVGTCLDDYSWGVKGMQGTH